MPESNSFPRTESRPHSSLDIGALFRAHGDEYRHRYALSPEQSKVMGAIALCRTAALGGHLDVCDSCGYERPAYNSCRNRHCSKCQSLAQAKWLEERKERILPTHYFHVVFTIPQELRALARRNPRELYGLLFASSAATLQTLAMDDKWLGAQLGFTSVLHTWTRKLHYHPHVHCIVTGGGLAADEQRWVACRRNFLFPVTVMSELFRGKFLHGLRRLYEAGKLDCTGIDQLESEDGFRRLESELYRHKWVVYIKPPFGGAEQVYAYLGRYTHRVAISNSRLIEVTDDKVCFATKHGQKTTLSPLEFIRRFLLHVLPKSFVKIRHYGLLASANVATKLVRARELLQQGTRTKTAERDTTTADLSEKNWREHYEELTGHDLTRCPKCEHGTMISQPLPVQILFKAELERGFWDSS